ncbi:unnamed protein product [Sphenostylis stenocarpa]|uniref:Patatin n=1 Tax=Sphenostylis stenocarpa TaxID=92480 RepID=A0AA86SJQ4_9FABA|nr:unnamed protein product [Sphenostylis stenocarpa]
MAPILLFTLVFATQLMAGLSSPPPPLPPPSYGNRTSILSIDGGGIRGIIPATVLEYLENALKKKDPDTSLAHYFDVMSGTSTGGLMATMLAAPNPSDSNHPLFTSSQIVRFYKTYGPKIFEPRFFPSCPKYNGKFLPYLIDSILKETRLNQTLTNIVIPTFDQRRVMPVIFSNFKLKTETYLNAKLSDICLGTSAAPTYLPSHKFKNEGVYFNLVDGAMAANNPAVVAVSEVIQHSERKDMIMLSLGTGIVKPPLQMVRGFFEEACELYWTITHSGVISEALFSTDITHYYLATVFPGLLPPENYLRIQEYSLNPSLEPLDNADEKNMNKLEKVGDGLLQQKVKRMNVNTFVPVELDHTNAQALDSFAEKLYEERQLRLKRKSIAKGRRPSIENVKVPSGEIRVI